MDLNEIVIFVRVVEAGSFTAAAKELELPKSTVSRKISGLEERLGVRLLQRTTRKLHLTDAGNDYYRRCARIVREIEEAELAIASMQSTPSGRLRLTAPLEFASAGMSELVLEFGRRYPRVSFEIELTGRRVDLIEEGFDLAIRAGRLPDSTLVAVKLGSSRRRVVASDAYLEAHGTPQTPADLEAHRCIVHNAPTWRLQGPTGPISVPVSGPLRVNSLAMVRHSALNGLGLAMLPELFFQDDVDAGRLTIVLEAFAPPADGLHAVYPSTRNLSPKVRAFVEFLRARWRAATLPELG